jgi:hypothetical protein
MTLASSCGISVEQQIPSACRAISVPLDTVMRSTPRSLAAKSKPSSAHIGRPIPPICTVTTRIQRAYFTLARRDEDEGAASCQLAYGGWRSPQRLPGSRTHRTRTHPQPLGEYPPQTTGMASSHISQVWWNRVAGYYRTVNPALLRFRKAPERVRVIHRRHYGMPDAPGIALDWLQGCYQRGHRTGHQPAAPMSSPLPN